MAKIFYRREDVDYTKFLFDNLSENSIIIAPEQFSFHVERESFKYMGRDAVLGADIIGFSRFGEQILKKSGKKAVKITSEGKNMLLTKIAIEKKDELSILGDMALKRDFGDLMQDVIRDLKQSNLSPQDFEAFLSEIPKESVLSKKLRDILIIYEAFNEAMEGNFVDSQSFVDLYNSCILESSFLENKDIWIYGFDAFDEKRLETIRLLNNKVRSLNIILTYENTPYEDELFLCNKVSFDRLKSALSSGINSISDSDIVEIPDEYKLDRDESINKIDEALYNLTWNSRRAKYIYKIEKRRNIYNWIDRKHNNNNISESYTLRRYNVKFRSPSVKVVKCANPYNQAVAAASFVQHLLRDEGMRLRDIGIISNGIEEEAYMYKEVFSDFDIPLFIDEKKTLAGNPVFMYVKALINVLQRGFKGNSTIDYLKWADRESEETIEEFELYSKTFSLNHKSWLSTYDKGINEYGEDSLKAFNDIRISLLEPVKKLLDKLENTDTVKDRLRYIYEFLLNDGDIKERIKAFSDSEDTEMEDALEVKQLWEKLVDLMIQMIELLGNCQIDLEKTLEILLSGISSIQVGIIPPNTDALIVGDSSRIKKGITKATLILGANEGLIPKGQVNSSLINTEDVKALEKAGIFVGRSIETASSQSNLDIYRNLASTTDKIYISYSSTDGSGEPLEKSEIVSRIQDIFVDIEDIDPISSEDICSLIGGKHMVESLILREEEKAFSENRPVSPWVMELKNIIKNPTLMKAIDDIGKEYGFNDVDIDIIRALYLRDREMLKLSPSRLEKFGKCPFAHFMTYGLRPRIIKDYNLEGSDLGSIYHDCIRQFSEQMSANNMAGWKSNLTEEDIDLKVIRILDEIYEDYREGLLLGEGDREYRKERIFKVCCDSIKAIYEQISSKEVEDMLFEASFGRGKKIPQISIKSSDDALAMSLEGQIDRLDILPGKISRVIDYKSGNDTFNLSESKKGIKLQLFIYLLASVQMRVASEELRPGGSFIFSVKDNMSNDNKKESYKLDGFWHKDIEDSVDKKFAIYSKERSLEEENFNNLMDEMKMIITNISEDIADGKIDALPKKMGNMSSCTYCDFKGICKFDTSIKGCFYDKN